MAVSINLNIGDDRNVDQTVTDGHFGLNFVSDFERIGDHSWESFDDVAYLTGATNLRYPGGITAEKYFDIRDPNASFIDLGDGSNRRTMGAYDFAEFCKSNGYSATYIIPTAQFLLPSGGDGYVVDESLLTFLYDFVYQALVASDGAVKAFEIGNEYETHMTSQEYGMLVEALTPVVDEAIGAFQSHYGALAEEPMIAIQVWSIIANEESDMTLVDLAQRSGGVWSQLSEETISRIDAAVTHWYTKDYGRSYQETYWDLEANISDSISLLNHYDELTSQNMKLMVSEWNANHLEEVFYGMAQVAIIVRMFAEFVQSGVNDMDFWSAQYHATSLGHSNGEMTVAGATFAYLRSEIIGSSVLDLETGTETIGGYAFLNGDATTLSLSNLSEESTIVEVDYSFLGEGAEIVALGAVRVDTSTADGTWKSREGFEYFNEPDLVGYIDWLEVTETGAGTLMVSLDPYQTIFVELHDQTQISGTPNDDVLVATEEANVFNGGEGLDMVSFQNFAEGVAIDLGNGLIGSDAVTFDSIEGIVGTAYDDFIIGDAQINTLVGGGGTDVINGLGGDDFLLSSGGASTLNGQEGNDTFVLNGGTSFSNGGDGNDVFVISDGNHTICGGSGLDTIDLSESKDGVTFWVDEGVVETEGSLIGFSEVEFVAGSDFDDRLTIYFGYMSARLGDGDDSLRLGVGSEGEYRLNKGDDFAFNEGGDVFIHGGDGNDKIMSAGNATILGGNGADTLYSFGANDTFIFNLSDDDDVIHGFKVGDTEMEFSYNAVLALRNGSFDVSQTTNGAMLNFTEGGSIDFAGMTVDLLEYCTLNLWV